MQTTLAALAVVAVGYILAYLLFDRLRDRYGYVGGAEYVLIGVLLGPQISGLLGAGQVQDLTPIVSLAVGWLGMLLGTYFRLPTLALLPREHVATAFAEALATFAAALAALLALFRSWPGTAGRRPRCKQSRSPPSPRSARPRRWTRWWTARASARPCCPFCSSPPGSMRSFQW